MNVLLASIDDSMLERIGLMLTDWGFVPQYCTDPDVLVTSLRNQEVDVQIVLIDANIASNNPVKLVSDIRSSNITGYQFICVLKDATDIEQQTKFLFAGADLVLPLDYSVDVFQAHIHVASRMMQHQLKQRLLQQSLWNQANHDPLTEISNRRSILRTLEREATLSGQRLNPLGVLMMDLDFFKQINDRFGHDCGDAVLKETASRLKKCIRNSDSVGRFGGEEFLAVIPNCSGEELVRLAERIRQSIKKPMLYKQILIPMSISIGVSVHFQPETEVMESLRLADQALYVAKEMGRNRVVCAWMLDGLESKIG